MVYFEKDFLKFYHDLSQNNNTAWFNENRLRYENSVKKPFIAFVGDFINLIRNFEPDITLQPADAIFRINRDIRFSKDKTPYKTHSSAIISKYGRKDKCYPGIYFEFTFDKVMFYGGAWSVEPKILQKIRQNIANNLPEFKKAYKNKEFKNKFGSIQGEKAKKIPPELKSAAEEEPLIYNKQFYFGAELPAELILKDELIEVLLQHYLVSKELNDFLRSAFE